jgi:23S rRNA (pseudouridine1915-N3)-methyltransferase
MLHVNIYAVGRLKERFWREACEEYLKRLRRYARVSVVEVADIDPATCGGEAQARERESHEVARLLRKAAGADARNSLNILLDISGEALASEDIAALLAGAADKGKSTVNIVVGGSGGIDASLLPSLDCRVSFGRITLPHNLARVVCLEQLYRAFRINANEPYHK